MTKKHCENCGQPMQRWGKTQAGKTRFFCVSCKKSSTWRRKDVLQRKIVGDLNKWLGGKESLSEVAHEAHKTRQAMWKEFHPLFLSVTDPYIPDMTQAKILTLDATYIHGHSLCALIAIDENDKIYWKFAPYESYKYWIEFLSSFRQPEIVIMDGQKGLFAAARTLWHDVPIQRCQFHVIAFAIQYVGRQPKDAAGKALLNILYRLKYAKTPIAREHWIFQYKFWERMYLPVLAAKTVSGNFQNPRLRSTRLIIRKALPFLFTFLDHPGAPNTTNLVEGWVNGTIAEALRMHRGLRVQEKKMLVSIILSKLTRKRKPVFPVTVDQKPESDTVKSDTGDIISPLI